MNFLDKPFHNEENPNLPPYPFYGYDNAEELDKDVDYMKSLYSRVLKMIQQEVDEECDKLEYGGSCMFDAFPDQVHLGIIIDSIYDRIKDTDWDLQAEQVNRPGYRPPTPPSPMPCRGSNCPPPPPIPCRGNNCPPPPPIPCRGSNCPPPPRPSRPPQPPRPDYRPDGKPDWQRDLIASLLYNEMIHRRRRYRSRNRWNNR